MNKTKSKFSVPAGVTAIIYGVISLIGSVANALTVTQHYDLVDLNPFTIFSMLVFPFINTICLIMLGIVALNNIKKIITVIPFALLTVIKLAYAVTHIIQIIQFRSVEIYNVINILMFIPYVLMLAYVITNCNKPKNGQQPVLNKVWILPAILLNPVYILKVAEIIINAVQGEYTYGDTEAAFMYIFTQMLSVIVEWIFIFTVFFFAALWLKSPDVPKFPAYPAYNPYVQTPYQQGVPQQPVNGQYYRQGVPQQPANGQYYQPNAPQQPANNSQYYGDNR